MFFAKKKNTNTWSSRRFIERTLWQTQASDNFLGHSAELGRNERILMEKPDGFIKLLTEY